MKIENWFSTPILFNQFVGEDLDSIQKELSIAISEIKPNISSNPWGDNLDTSFLYNEENKFLYDNSCDNLIQKIYDSTDYFFNLHNLEKDNDVKITESWVNFCDYGQGQSEHSHYNKTLYDNFLSGVYYYQTVGTGDDGKIEFISPNPIQACGISLFGDPVVTFTPEVGKMLLFPSWLRHRVRLNTTNNIRISVTFNLGKKRRIG